MKKFYGPTILRRIRTLLIIFLVLHLYTLWLLLWIGFNVFIALLYLEVLGLSHKESLNWLSIKQDGQSWFATNSFGCSAHDNSTSTGSNDSKVDCSISYEYLEVTQAGIQILLSFVNICLSVWFIIKITNENKDEQFTFIGGFDPNSMQRSTVSRTTNAKVRYVRDGYDVW